MTNRNRPNTEFAFLKRPLSHCIKTVIAGSILTATTQAHALNFDLTDEINVDVDTSLTYDAQWRMKNPSEQILAGGNLNGNHKSPGTAALLMFDADDGNRNFKKHDMTANKVSFSTDIDLTYKNGGVFARVRGWYDDVYNDDDLLTQKNPAAPGVGQTVGQVRPQLKDGLSEHQSDLEILDLFVHNNFDIGDQTASLRVGRQVVSWGESMFVGGGVSSAQSPVDATKANNPGVELKDIFLPLGQVYLETSLNDAVSVGAYYQWEWEHTRIDAPGSFFNVLDTLGQGSTGDVADTTHPVAHKDADEGQFGLAVRYMAEDLNNTEFGLYYLQYNDFFPSIQFIPGVIGPGLTNTHFEDINLIGASFGTVFGDTNVSGEITYRDGQPVQLASPGFYFAKGETVQAQVSVIHLFGDTPIADNLTFFGEVGYNRVLGIDLSAENETVLALVAPGFNANNIGASLDNDRGAAGATVRLKADYFSVANGLDMSVAATYKTNFNGVSSVPFTFTESADQLALKVDFNYLSGHSFGASYVAYLADLDKIVEQRGELELAHLNQDRDNFSVFYKYRF
ncbi:MAG: DUF1302 family protein [Motiliproteus sp.]